MTGQDQVQWTIMESAFPISDYQMIQKVISINIIEKLIHFQKKYFYMNFYIRQKEMPKNMAMKDQNYMTIKNMVIEMKC